MLQTTTAVYEKGVLRLARALRLKEREQVAVIIFKNGRKRKPNAERLARLSARYHLSNSLVRALSQIPAAATLPVKTILALDAFVGRGKVGSPLDIVALTEREDYWNEVVTFF